MKLVVAHSKSLKTSSQWHFIKYIYETAATIRLNHRAIILRFCCALCMVFASTYNWIFGIICFKFVYGALESYFWATNSFMKPHAHITANLFNPRNGNSKYFFYLEAISWKQFSFFVRETMQIHRSLKQDEKF
jgi:hypothetical protein